MWDATWIGGWTSEPVGLAACGAGDVCFCREVAGSAGARDVERAGVLGWTGTDGIREGLEDAILGGREDGGGLLMALALSLEEFGRWPLATIVLCNFSSHAPRSISDNSCCNSAILFSS